MKKIDIVLKKGEIPFNIYDLVKEYEYLLDEDSRLKESIHIQIKNHRASNNKMEICSSCKLVYKKSHLVKGVCNKCLNTKKLTSF